MENKLIKDALAGRGVPFAEYFAPKPTPKFQMHSHNGVDLRYALPKLPTDDRLELVREWWETTVDLLGGGVSVKRNKQGDYAVTLFIPSDDMDAVVDADWQMQFVEPMYENDWSFDDDYDNE